MIFKRILKDRLHGNALILLVLFAASALRLTYVMWLKNTPVGEKMLIDSAYYHREALRLVSEGWIGDQVFFMNPFYSYFLALIYTYLGPSWQWIWIIQSAMGTMICYFTYVLGGRLWNKRVGLIAAAFLALYGALVFYDGALLTASPILFLNTWALMLLFGRKRLHWTSLIGAGILLGLSATARPFSIIFALAMVPIFFRANRAKFVKNVIFLWGGIFLAVMPVIMRNYAIGGEWGLTTSSAGMNFYVGNHPGATGIYAQVDFLSTAEPDREREEFMREADRRCQCELTPGEASRYWFGQGLTFIIEYPQEYGRLLLRKAYFFLNQVESQNNLSFYFARDFSPILRWAFVGWWLVCPLGIAGWFASPRALKWSPLAIYFLCYWLGCMMFFVSSEYRLPVVPVLALYGAHMVLFVWQAVRKGRLVSLSRPFIALVLIAIPVIYKDILAQKLTLRRVDYYNFAALYERDGNMEQAANLYQKSLEIDPYFQPARTGLERTKKGAKPTVKVLDQAQSAFQRAEYDEAINKFKEAIRRGHNEPETYNNWGLSLYKVGQMQDAEQAFENALKIRPGYDKAAFNMALVKRAQGASDAAHMYIDQALSYNPTYRQALYKRGEWAAEEGNYVRAVSDWEKLSELVGGDERLQVKIDSLNEVIP